MKEKSCSHLFVNLLKKRVERVSRVCNPGEGRQIHIENVERRNFGFLRGVS